MARSDQLQMGACATERTRRAPGALDWGEWRARWPNAAASRFVEAGGVRWHVQVAGDGAPILLVHGTGGATHGWRDVLPRLARRHTVIAPDLPGHAFTSMPAPHRQSIPGMAAALAALLAELRLAPRLVVGHSAGAAVLVRMALDGALPEARRLVGLNAALVAPPALAMAMGRGVAGAAITSGWLAHGVAALARRGALIEGWLRSTGSTLDAGLVALYRALVGSPAHVRAAATMMARWDVPALLGDVHALRLPSTLLVGDRDAWITPAEVRRVVRYVPGAELEVVAGHGHLMHEQAGDEFAERLLRAADEAERTQGRPDDGAGDVPRAVPARRTA